MQTRVSGLMTNAPYILNVDCDMFVNNPKILLHAMCLLQDPIIDKQYAFVQFPQSFYNGLKDDPYGNQFHVMLEVILSACCLISQIFFFQKIREAMSVSMLTFYFFFFLVHYSGSHSTSRTMLHGDRMYSSTKSLVWSISRRHKYFG